MRRLDRLIAVQRALGFAAEAGLIEQDVDMNIYPLLLIMNFSGNQTFASCGGHSNGKLGCWTEADGDHLDDAKYGGYVEFKPNSPDLLDNLEYFVKHYYRNIMKEKDVWLNQTFGIGLKTTHERHQKLSWYLKSYNSNLKFIRLLEAFFIARIASNHDFKKAVKRP